MGSWEISTAYVTECTKEVELNSYKILSEYLDEFAPFEKLLNCSVQDASQTVESVSSELGLLEQARKQVQSTGISEKYGSCPMCGGNLTRRGSCPSCIERVWGH